MMTTFAVLAGAIYIAVLAVNLNKALRNRAVGKSNRADRPIRYWIQITIMVIAILALASVTLYTLYYIINHIKLF
jgi:hypothetical protein